MQITNWTWSGLETQELTVILPKSGGSSIHSVSLVANKIPNRRISYTVGAFLDTLKRLHFTADTPQRLICFSHLVEEAKEKKTPI